VSRTVKIKTTLGPSSKLLSVRPWGSRYLNRGATHVALAACASNSERPSTGIGNRDPDDLDRIEASLDALALCCWEPGAEEGRQGQWRHQPTDTSAETHAVGGVIPMPVRPFSVPGVFGPEAIAAMTEALDGACEVLHDAGPPELLREITARRIIAAATFGERDPVRLRAAALAGRQLG